MFRGAGRFPQIIIEKASPSLLVRFVRQRLTQGHLFYHVREHATVLQYRRSLLTTAEWRQLAHTAQQEPPRVRVGQRAEPSEHLAAIKNRRR